MKTGLEKGRRVIEKINSFLEHFFVLFMAVMILIVILQVFFRYVIGRALAWSEEISIYMMIWGALLGGSIGLGKGKHIAINTFYYRLPAVLKRLVSFLKIGVVLFYIYILIYYGYQYAQTGWRFISPATRLPRFWVFIAIPIAGCLMLLQLFINPFISKKKDSVVEKEIQRQGSSHMETPVERKR